MNDIRTWLAGLGFRQYTDVFAANDVDLASIGLMTDADFEKLGVTLGHRKRLLKAAATLVDRIEPASAVAPTASGVERRPVIATEEPAPLPPPDGKASAFPLHTNEIIPTPPLASAIGDASRRTLRELDHGHWLI